MKGNLKLVVDNTHKEEETTCLWRIFNRFRDECFRCDLVHSCLIEAVLQPAQDEFEFPLFIKQIRGRLNKANKIWKKLNRG